MSAEIVEVPARSGRAVVLAKGESVKLINTMGSQVVDTFAFSRADLSEHMSMEHTRVMLGKVNPKKGDALYSNRRRVLRRSTPRSSAGGTPAAGPTISRRCFVSQPSSIR